MFWACDGDITGEPSTNSWRKNSQVFCPASKGRIQQATHVTFYDHFASHAGASTPHYISVWQLIAPRRASAKKFSRAFGSGVVGRC
eukprot:4780860-Prymnesium_polylepis.1